MMQYLTGGADLTAIALFINRIALGAFFTISGFHKLFNRQRHAVFVRELVTDRVPRLGFNQWFVPSIALLDLSQCTSIWISEYVI
jgi:uncharacterized membrane protein YphA (DoxX/SURF4 family)